jgi:hypothetical protein
MAGGMVFALKGALQIEGLVGIFKDLGKVEGRAKELATGFRQLSKSLIDIGSRVSLVSAPLIALGATAVKLAKSTGEYADKLSSLNQATGLSTDTLQEFEHVAVKAGVG